jgi:hypothetical protein
VAVEVTNLRRVAADLQALGEDVDDLIARVEPILSSPTSGPVSLAGSVGVPGSSTPSPGAAHVWHALTATEASRAWTQLGEWVDWLVARYALDDTLPGCWYAHGALVDELDALRAAWTAAYLDPAARPTEPAYWLDLLGRTLDRVRGWDRYGCAAGTHHDDTAPVPDEGARVARDQHIHADIKTRADAFPQQSEAK